MQPTGLQIALAVIAAAAVGFLIALLAFGGDNGNNAAVVGSGTTTTTATTGTATEPTTTQTTTTTTTVAPAPQSPQPTTASCIALWNQPTNRGAQIFLVNIAAQQPVRVHVGQTTDVPPKCLITVVANNGAAYVYPEGGGTTYPYAPVPSQTKGSTLPAEQRKSNALEQRDGTLAPS